VLGYYFGANWKLIDTVISRIGIIFSTVIVLGLLYAFQVRRKKRLDALNTQLNPDSGKIDNLL
jgi:membrane protein DedA with SNARE-associated domain